MKPVEVRITREEVMEQLYDHRGLSFAFFVAPREGETVVSPYAYSEAGGIWDIAVRRAKKHGTD